MEYKSIKTLCPDSDISFEYIEHTFSGNVDFGKKTLVTITRNGDSFDKMHLKLTIPKLPIDYKWRDDFIFRLINKIEYFSGGSKINQFTGMGLYIKNLFKNDKWLYKYGLTNVDSTKDNYITIPLPDFSSEPIILKSLYKHELWLIIELNPLSLLIENYSDDIDVNVSVKDASVMVQYLYFNPIDIDKNTAISYNNLYHSEHIIDIENPLLKIQVNPAKLKNIFIYSLDNDNNFINNICELTVKVNGKELYEKQSEIYSTHITWETMKKKGDGYVNYVPISNMYTYHDDHTVNDMDLNFKFYNTNCKVGIMLEYEVLLCQAGGGLYLMKSGEMGISNSVSELYSISYKYIDDMCISDDEYISDNESLIIEL
jgi:hypothetical protein